MIESHQTNEEAETSTMHDTQANATEEDKTVAECLRLEKQG